VTAYLARRLGLSALVIAGVVCLTFLIARVVPGDPAASWAGPRAGPAQVASVRRELGLNRPIVVQIVSYFKGIFSGDWGTSIHTHRPVLSDILIRLPSSLELVLPAIFLGLVIGVALGVICARWSGGPIDHVVRSTAVLAVSLPAFLLAIILQEVFAQRLHVLPAAGQYAVDLQFSHPLSSYTGFPLVDALLTGNWPVLASAITHLILPALIVAAYPIGVVARMVRARLLDVEGETHMQMARSLGFSERVVLTRFALRLAWSPVAQVVALVFAYSLVNTFLVEATFYVAANLAVDLVQAALDPRIRLR
jgi:peptide/nickel transport system permease protein